MMKRLNPAEPEVIKGPYELPEDWKWMRLGDVCEKPRYGYTQRASKEKIGPKFLRITDIDEDGKIDWDNVPFCKCTEKEKYQVKAGDIFIARAGSIGRSTLIEKDKEAVFASYLIRMRPKPEVHAKYVAYFLKSPEYWKQLFEGSLGTTMKNVNARALSKIKIPLSSINEQRSLVAILDRVFSRLSKAEKSLKESGKAIDKIMSVAIKRAIPTEDPLPEGWRWEKLEDVATTTSGGTPSRAKKEYYGGDIPWVKSGELEDLLIVKSEETITEEGLKNSSAKFFPKGTLLIALYGATVGRLGVLEIDAATNQAVCAIFENKSKLFRDYLWYFLLNLRKELVAKSFGGAQPNISQTFLRNMQIPLPPLETLPSLEEQKQIVSHLNAVSERVDKLRTLHKEASIKVERIKASLLSKAFRGEI